jgi:hypothetical protein
MIAFWIALFLMQIGFPGQYPPGQYPPGQTPPNRYPSPGIPTPGRKSKKPVDTKAPPEPVLIFQGYLRKLEPKSFEVYLPDTRTLIFGISEETAKIADVAVGDYVEAEAHKYELGPYPALGLKKIPAPADAKPPASEAGPVATAAAAPESVEHSATVVKPGPLYDEGDSGPPKLKRGMPKPRPKAVTAEKTPEPAAAPEAHEPAAETPVAAKAELFQNAQLAAREFVAGLPNYACQQFTTRYVSEGRVTDWKARDVVSADLIFDNGAERYEHLTINGKTPKDAVEKTGSWSTGEFGSMLADVVAYSSAVVKHTKDTTVSGRAAGVFTFDVTQPNSHWTVWTPSQWVRPGYRGTLWIDKSTARVLRIEQQGREIPKDFPLDTVEGAVDFEFVRLGSNEFLLPTHAESLECFRGTSSCSRNVIEFRNYHKYAGESTIIFGK